MCNSIKNSVPLSAIPTNCSLFSLLTPTPTNQPRGGLLPACCACFELDATLSWLDALPRHLRATHPTLDAVATPRNSQTHQHCPSSGGTISSGPCHNKLRPTHPSVCGQKLAYIIKLLKEAISPRKTRETERRRLKDEGACLPSGGHQLLSSETFPCCKAREQCSCSKDARAMRACCGNS